MMRTSLYRKIASPVKKSLDAGLFLLLAFTLVFGDFVLYALPFISIDVPTEEASAATGDFAIYREVAGGDTINSDGTPFDLTWDTTVASSPNISLLGNSSDIDLAEGGKYFVSYNAWAYEGTAGGNNRRGIDSYLSLNGSTLISGRGSGYIRDSEGDLSAYANGAAIIDAGAGDELQVHVARNDTNTTGGTQVQPATNGVQIVKLPNDADYLRVSRTTASGDISGVTSFSGIGWDTASEVDTGSFTFSPTSADITLKGEANAAFLITYNLGLEDTTTGGTRQNYEARLTLGGVEIPGTRTTAYMRGTDDHRRSQLVFSGIVTKTSAVDQTLNVQIRRESSTGATTILPASESAVTIMAIPGTAELISISDDSGSQTTSLSATDMTFNSTDLVTSSSFSHSTSTNSNRVTVNSAGDYLFFSTAYSETTTSGNNRQPFRINWKANGTPQNYGGYGSYNRANSTFTSGASGALIVPGMSVSDYITIEHIDETTSAPVDATFAANRVALQGVKLNANFYGVSVTASSLGSQIATADIDTTDVHVGGSFVLVEESSSRNVTNITLTESGTVDAENSLQNIKLFYDLDTSAPYDCAGESYSGSESQYGFTDINGFSGTNGVSSFSDVVSISTTQALCLYVTVDINSNANDLDTMEIAIENPANDIVVTGTGSVGPSSEVAPTGSTIIRGPELTQVHYHWINDDGVEGAASTVDGAEDTPAAGFSDTTARRLRMQISAEGSTSSPATALRLEYGQKMTTCEDVSTWTDVSDGGGDWDMADSTFIVDGSNSTDLTPANGGTTNENTTHLSPNGALKDTSSQLGSLVFNTNNFLETEFSISPTLAAAQGNTYCFRLTNAGDPLKNYSIYPEATLSADITVAAVGSQVSTIDIGTADAYFGGAFSVTRQGANRTLTSITIQESGTIDARNLYNPRLYYDLDTSSPYDCASESYALTDSSLTGSNFTSDNGTTTFTTSINIGTTQAFCGYFVADVAATSSDSETVIVEIGDPSSDVVVTGSSVGPASLLSPTGSTALSGPVLTQTHYHWRFDNGSETGATSASGGNEDTAIQSVKQLDNRRLRLQVSNEGNVTSAARSFVLEYGNKVTTCDAIANWSDINTPGGAFNMSTSSEIADGDTTNFATSSFGALTDENSSFIGTGMLRESSGTTSAVSLTSTEFTEMEFSIAATEESAFAATYCFRVTTEGEPLNDYTFYPEMTLREREDYFVQRGDETVTGTSLTLNAGFDYVAPSSTSSAFVRITNSQHTGAGNSGGSTNQNADDFTAYISDQTDITNSFTIQRPSTAVGNTRVSWELVEFVGSPGTDNEMIVRDTGSLTVNSPSLNTSGAAVSGVNDSEDVVVFITGQGNTDTARSQLNDGLFIAEFDATSSIPTFERADGDLTAYVSYAVVEFTGVNWSVERVAHTYTSAGVTETESIEAIPAVNRGFVHAQKMVGEGLSGLDEFGHQVWLSSLGAVSFQLRASAGSPSLHTSVAWVIANTQSQTGAMQVFRSNGTIAANGPAATAEVISIGGTVTEDSSSIFATNDSNGSGTAFPRPIAAYSITSPTTYELWRSNTGQPIDFRTSVVDWPAADTAFTQNFYRIYVNSTSTDVTDPWPLGPPDLGENEALTSLDDPVGEGEVLRLRMSLRVRNANLPALASAFKLQYGLRTTSCSAIESWNDVGVAGGGAIWRGYEQVGIIDGEPVTTETPAPGLLKLSVSDEAGTVEEDNPSDLNPYFVAVGDDVEYDWSIEHNGASQRSDYCFRMVYNDDTPLATYSHYPTIRTTGFSPVVSDWRWYDDETNLTPTASLAAENVTPSDVSNQNLLKLRVVVDETENADGLNTKFALQYSEYADFRDGGTYLTRIQDCTENSLWCYADGNGADNDVISNPVISSADACVGGDGCGTRNEVATSSSSFTHNGGSATEYEFTIRHAGARANALYYFRLIDVNLEQPVVASSSNPNLLTESAVLDFSVDSVPAATSVAGVVTDATSTPVSVDFGRLAFNEDQEVAQRITVDSNATEGYRILQFSSGQMTNSYGDILSPITATNASPLSWATGCVGGSSSCVGYHTTDATLSNGQTARFAADDTYAALSTNPAEIIFSSVPVTTVHDIVYRVRTTEQQTAGVYETAITYLAIPVH